ncbi:protein kinase [Acidobacteriota bacterium]
MMEKLGKYTILEELGKGAMGVVYKALDPDINRQVAIKLIRIDRISEGGDIEDMARRFIREAQSAGKLEHPNIITIYEVGRENNQTYIVMQYVEGDSLKEIISSSQKLSLQEVVKMTTSLCSALDYAHKHRIVHRDIKPANILINKAGQPFLVDFGVARVDMSTLTQSGTIVGTPSYMAPEQVAGKTVDSRADIFSLGVIIYELLTGMRPFYGDHITTIVYKIMNEEPPSLREAKKDLPVGFEHVLKKALSKDPQTRYQTCGELAEDLKIAALSTDDTISTGLGRKEITQIRKKRSSTKIVGYAVATVGILLAGITAAYFFLPDLRDQVFSSREKQAFVLNEVKPPVTRSLDDVMDPFETDFKELEESFDNGDFEQAAQIADKIITKEPSNVKARDYLENAQKEMAASAVANALKTGVASYKNGNYKSCLKIMRDVLDQDKDNKEAKKYIALANQEISKREIKVIIERQRKTEEGKDLLTLLSDIGSSSLAGQRKTESTDFFNTHDGVKSFVSKIDIQFQDQNQATVVYSNLVSAVPKATGVRKVIFEGQVTLTMKRQGKNWKIIEYRKKSI